MIEVKNLSAYRNDGTELMKDISFSVRPGDKIAVIGEEGNGKSTLLKILHDRSLVGDHLSLEGQVITDHEITGYLPQHLPEEWLNAIPSDFLLKEAPETELRAEDYNRLALYQTLADEMHLPKGFLEQDLPLGSLSGGERVKLQLLKLLGSPSTALLLDEPTNDLDIDTLEFLEGFIQKLTIPVLFVSHDETLLESAANRILHLEQLNVKTIRRFTDYSGSYRSYVEERLQGYEKTQQIARKEKAEYLDRKRRLNDIMNAVHSAQKNISRQDPAGGRLLKKKMHSVKAMERRFERESYRTVDQPEEAINVFFPVIDNPPAKRILDLNAISITVPGRQLIAPFDLLVTAREKLVITGSNGSGKTLLLTRLHKELKDRTDLRIGCMPQDYMKGLNGYATALDFLVRSGIKQDVERARELMGAMKLTRDEMLKDPDELSDGQKAKLFMLRFIKEGTDVLILDEPTRNFSPLSAPVIREILSDYTGCILSVSHDRIYISNVATRQMEIQDGRLVEIHR